MVPLMLSNLSSNYTQLGLAFTLFSAEVLFNKGNSFVQHTFLFFLLIEILSQVSR